MKGKIISVAIVLLLITSALSIFANLQAYDADEGAGPDGNWEDFRDTDWYTDHPLKSEYYIRTAEQLAGLAYLVNTDTLALKGKKIFVENDVTEIDLSAHYWRPIGSFEDRVHSFKSIFDGQGVVIKGMYIGSVGDTKSHAGLFGFLEEGSVKNVGVSNSVVYGNEYVGGIVGLTALYCEVTNCYSTADIISDGKWIGGIVGYNLGYISNCYNTGRISGGTYVGGITGLSITSVKDCYNTGDISGSKFIGGIVGGNYSDVENCYNRGKITGSNNGPIVGQNGGGEVTDCHWLESPDFPGTEGSLQMEQMIGMGALNHMTGFDAGVWITAESIKATHFFPQLDVFANSTNGIVKADSLESVTIEKKLEVKIIQDDIYVFIIGQKLSDIDPGLYVSVPSGVTGTFTWENGDSVMNELGDFTAKIIFTPDEIEYYLVSSIQVNITVVEASPPEPPGPESEGFQNSLLFFAVALVTLITLFYIGVVKEE